MLDEIPIGVIAFDRELRYRFLNRSVVGMSRMLQPSPQGRLLREVLTPYYGPDEVERLESEFRQVLASGEPSCRRWSLQQRLPERREDGWLEWSAHRIDNAAGETVGLILLVQDATRHVVAYHRLAEHERLLALILDAVPALVSYVDTGQRYVLANRAYELLLKRPRTEIVGRTLREVVGEAAYGQVRDQVEQALAGHEVSYEREVRYPDQDPRCMQVHLVPDRDQSGVVRGYVALLQDITQRRRMEGELRQFAHSLGHDVQEPLRTISMYQDLALERLQEDPDFARSAIQRAQAAARRLRDLTQGLLDYVTAGEQRSTMTTVALGDTLQEALQILDEAIQDCDGRIELVTELPTVIGNRARLTALWQNLIGNALRHGGGGIVIRIAAERLPQEDGARWRFSVSDTGPGVPADLRERIFNPFERGSSHGTAGLGLALCRRIVESMGGRIWVEEAAGGGADFRFTLPAEPSQRR